MYFEIKFNLKYIIRRILNEAGFYFYLKKKSIRFFYLVVKAQSLAVLMSGRQVEIQTDKHKFVEFRSLALLCPQYN